MRHDVAERMTDRPMTDGAPRARQAPPTVLALVDLTADDLRVVEATRALAEALGAAVGLLHVAAPIPRHANGHRDGRWERMASVEAAARQALRGLAGRLHPSSAYVQMTVRFGDTVEQVGKAVAAVDASMVVASSRSARWLPWRTRDRALRRSLDIPVILVHARDDKRGDGLEIDDVDLPAPYERSAA